MMDTAGAPAMTRFSTMIDAMTGGGDQFSIVLPDDWLQGRTAYGGLSAAVCLEATLQAFADLPPLRSAQFAFVGPATGVLRLAPKILRQGKSAVFTSVDLEGDSGLAVRGTFCFGAHRPMPLEHGSHPMPSTPARDACPSYYSWPNRPNFMQHFEGRLAAGGAPLSRGPSPEMLVWLRHGDAVASDSAVSLLALADALPPASFVVFPEAVTISTMTWSLDLLESDISNPSGWWLVHSAAEHIRDGYSAQTSVIWHPDGRPILSARQNIGVFGKR